MKSIFFKEPSPPWPSAPRYSDPPFPPYRFMPGYNLHPVAPRAGQERESHEGKPLLTDQWQTNKTYLFGVDLYHQGYFWESHEAWESLWHLTDKEGAAGQFLQGLIQNSAAQLKIHLQQWTAARHLSKEAYRHLSFTDHVNNTGSDHQSFLESFMGLPLSDFLESIKTHYQPLWDGKKKTSGAIPLLILTIR